MGTVRFQAADNREDPLLLLRCHKYAGIVTVPADPDLFRGHRLRRIEAAIRLAHYRARCNARQDSKRPILGDVHVSVSDTFTEDTHTIRVEIGVR